jgi:TatD DNase family protein
METVKPVMIDTHTHLYLNQFDSDRAKMIERAENEGVTKFYLPGIDHEVMERMLEMERLFPGKCIAMPGLHPCSVKEDYEQELDFVAQWLEKRAFVAIGEIGLDFYWDRTFEKEQYVAFERQMEWALAKQLPIVIHTRNAMQETINTVKPFAKRGLRGIFHCFSGSAESARQITGMGFHLGIGGVITYKNAGLGDALKDIGVEWLVLETDAPYLTPVPFRGKRNESSYLKYVVEKLAEVKNCSVAEVAAATTANAEKIFGH